MLTSFTPAIKLRVSYHRKRWRESAESVLRCKRKYQMKKKSSYLNYFANDILYHYMYVADFIKKKFIVSKIVYMPKTRRKYEGRIKMVRVY